jgi:hypothetical protein
VQALLSPDLASRDEEALLAGHHGVGVDDAEVDAGDDAAIRLSALDRNRDLRCHVEVQPSRLRNQGDRAERFHRVGDRPAEAHPQVGGTPGHTEPDPGTIDGEGSPAVAHRDQCPLAAGEVGHLGAVPLTKGSVAVDHPGPHVPGAAQQAVAAPSLGRGGAQGDPGGAVDLPSRTHVRKDSEGYRQKTAHSRGPRKKCSVAQTRSGPSKPRMNDTRVINEVMH